MFIRRTRDGRPQAPDRDREEWALKRAQLLIAVLQVVHVVLELLNGTGLF